MNYGKKSASKKQSRIGSKSRMRKKKIGIGFFKIFLLILVLGVLGVFAAGGMLVKRVIDKAPDITADDVKPSGYTSTIYDSDGDEIQTLVTSGANRIYVTIDEVPEALQKAFIAIEDERFYQHNGIDPKGILRAAATLLTSKGQSAQGASTITQQLIKNNIFPNFTEETRIEKVERKLQEQYLAIKLEKIMDKDQILENYMNTINLGQNTLGVQSAANRYFGKDVSKLTLSESAVIAGITQSPESYNPLTHPEANEKRRAKVLKNMLEQGYIDQEMYQEAIDDTEDVYKRIQTADAKFSKSQTSYSYFVDELVQQVIQDLQDQLGYSYTQAYSTLYGSGVSVYSTQDKALQKICDNVINDDSNYPMYTRYSIGSYALTITRANGEVENYSKEDFEKYLGDSKKLYYSTDDLKADAKAYRKSLLEKGDSYDQVLTSAKEPQASFVLMDQKTGYVKAIVGGRGKKKSSMSLNRATDTTRQPGSTFKVLSTYAPALDTGAYTLNSTERDEPYSYSNGRSIKNAYSGYKGTMTVRKAIAVSCNIIAVKVLTEITPQLGFDYLKDFGFTTLVENENGYTDIGQPLALGGITKGVTNLELTAAYASIANGGVYTAPILYSKILDHDGNVLIDNTPETHKVISESTAYNLTQAMEDVVSSGGTGTPARLSNMTCAGKTGTTSDSKDLWFCGFTPYYTAGIWTGYDDNQQLSSSYIYHKTMWKKIMEQIVDYENQANKDFELPDGVKEYTICTKTGLLATSSCPRQTAYFTEDSAPTKYCSGHYVAPTTDTDGSDDDSDGDDDSGNSNSDSNSGNSGSSNSGGSSGSGSNSGGSGSGSNSGSSNSGSNSGGSDSGSNSGGDSGSSNSGGSGDNSGGDTTGTIDSGIDSNIETTP